MKRSLALLVACLAFATTSRAKERYISLTNYVANAESICVCTVEKNNGDKTVTVRVDQSIKGRLAGSVVLKGETGHGAVRGPVTQFMKPGVQYLVFVFPNNRVGRLGGILPVQGGQLIARYIDGFTGAAAATGTSARLPLADAIGQIQAHLAGAGRSGADASLTALIKGAQVIAHVRILKVHRGSSDEDGVEECLADCKVLEPVKGGREKEAEFRFRFNRFVFHKTEEPLIVEKGRQYVVFLQGDPAATTYDLVDRWTGALPYHYHLVNRVKEHLGLAGPRPTGTRDKAVVTSPKF